MARWRAEGAARGVRDAGSEQGGEGVSEPCDCSGCRDWRASLSKPSNDALQEALRSLVDVLDRQGGYMTSEDQAALWQARRLVR